MKRSVKRRSGRTAKHAIHVAPHALIQQGVALHQTGRLAEAESVYRQLLALGQDPGVLHLLGVLLSQTSRAGEGVELIRRAVKLAPSVADFRANLAGVLGSLGRHEEAAEELRAALKLRPGDPHALNNLGAALEHLERTDESVAVLKEAVDRHPDFAEAWANLSNALRKNGNAVEAVDAACRAVALKPDMAEGWHALGAGLQDKGTGGQGDEGTWERGTQSAIPQHSAPSTQHLPPLDEAIFCLRRAVALRPEHVESHVSLAGALLLRGDWEEGFREHEWRRREARFARPHGKPWDLSTTCGRPEEDLAGKRLLLFAEGGLGNAIHYVRYVPMLTKWAAEVIVECHPALAPLLRQVKGIGPVIGFGEKVDSYDLYCPLPSLPALLTSTSSVEPGRRGTPPTVEAPYIEPDPARVDRWRERLDALCPRVPLSPCPPVPLSAFRVGVNWLAEQGTAWGRRRSIPLEQFAPLAAVPGVKLVSLQKGWEPVELDAGTRRHGDAGISATNGVRSSGPLSAPPRLRVPVSVLLGLDDDGGAFLDTAAVIRNLDLVITCDTSIAHLAGALGAEVWVALGAAADWRWMLDKGDTPWYPTMRLFRQRREGEWGPAFERMAECLSTRRRGDAETRGPGEAEFNSAIGNRQSAIPETQHPALGTAHREAFQRIYEQELWGGGSGHGSRRTTTEPYRNLLQQLLPDKQVERVVDLGCGDWQFSRLIDWEGIEYHGVDVVPAVIEANRQMYGRPNIAFECADIRTWQAPDADLYILKDVLQHWPDRDIKALLSRMAGRPMLITNSAPTADHIDLDLPGDFRPLDVRRPPFNCAARELLRYGSISGDGKLVVLT